MINTTEQKTIWTQPNQQLTQKQHIASPWNRQKSGLQSTITSRPSPETPLIGIHVTRTVLSTTMLLQLIHIIIITQVCNSCAVACRPHHQIKNISLSLAVRIGRKCWVKFMFRLCPEITPFCLNLDWATMKLLITVCNILEDFWSMMEIHLRPKSRRN